jgi:hypothetical protein
MSAEPKTPKQKKKPHTDDALEVSRGLNSPERLHVSDERWKLACSNFVVFAATDKDDSIVVSTKLQTLFKEVYNTEDYFDSYALDIPQNTKRAFIFQCLKNRLEASMIELSFAVFSLLEDEEPELADDVADRRRECLGKLVQKIQTSATKRTALVTYWTPLAKTMINILKKRQKLKDLIKQWTPQILNFVVSCTTSINTSSSYSAGKQKAYKKYGIEGETETHRDAACSN